MRDTSTFRRTSRPSSPKRIKKEKLTRSDRADKVLTHRVWGIPIFLVILFAVFHLTFSENFLFLNGFGDGWLPLP